MKIRSWLQTLWLALKKHGCQPFLTYKKLTGCLSKQKVLFLKERHPDIHSRGKHNITYILLWQPTLFFFQLFFVQAANTIAVQPSRRPTFPNTPRKETWNYRWGAIWLHNPKTVIPFWQLSTMYQTKKYKTATYYVNDDYYNYDSGDGGGGGHNSSKV